MNPRAIPRLADAFFQSLEDQCKLRKQRTGTDKVSGEPEWIVAERDHMLTIVNRERATLGKPALDLRPIRRVETMACGHSDYTRKFAIYCAELVLLDKEPKP